MFRDRIEAAQHLTHRLQSYCGRRNTIVLAIPRGGLPVGAVLARDLGLPLDVMLVKKIGHPRQPEFAIGAVSLTGASVDAGLAERSGVTRDYLDEEIARLRDLLRRRHEFYHGSARPTTATGKTIILTDDGAATGQTLMAAIGVLRREGAGEVVVAIPVAPRNTARTLELLADKVVCLLIPEDFSAIGQFYADFTQVSDKEATEILRETRISP